MKKEILILKSITLLKVFSIILVYFQHTLVLYSFNVCPVVSLQHFHY